MQHAILIAVASIAIAGGAAAQQAAPAMPGMDKPAMDKPAMDMKHMQHDGAAMGGTTDSTKADRKDSAATAGYKASMNSMMSSMPAFTGDADIDFMRQMRPHHQAAIDMAKIVLTSGKDAETKRLAKGIIATQQREINQIDRWLKKHGG